MPQHHLRRDFDRAGRARRRTALLLIAPLALFICVTFLAPLADMLRRSVYDPDLAQAWPRTSGALASWNGEGMPADPVFDALAEDMRTSFEARNIAVVARRLNYDLRDGRSLVMNTGRRVARMEAPEGSWRETIIGTEKRWGEPATWGVLKRAAAPVSDSFMLAALDLERNAKGEIVGAPTEERIYREVFARTFMIAASVTLGCLFLGFPVAQLIATVPPRIGNLLMILVLLPFWTSLVVRTAAWVVLLQDQGLVNAGLMALGLTEGPLPLIFNRAGVLIAMIHVLLPFMILPLYATMRTIPPSLVRAARSLGAGPVEAYLRVYLPQTLPGMAAGALLVFILALGYYITPALVGGADDQMVAYFIAFYTTQTVNWGLAGALGAILLAATLILYVIYNRIVGATRVSLG
jgi:putative spermidine/putrescine transport system permease protein